MSARLIEPALVVELERFSTPTILNGLKRLGLRPSDMEMTDRAAVRCTSPRLGVRCGFAVTRKVATGREPRPLAAGEAPRPTMADALRDMLTQPAPRFLVVENVGDYLGNVCIWGELGAEMNKAMGCQAGLTNGPVRDVAEMEAVGFQTFSGGPGLGGGFVDTLEIGGEVTVGGLTARNGDLLHGDEHGVVKIPVSMAADLPDAMRAHDAHERRIIDLCHSGEFSVDALLDLFRQP
ncbi:MAG: RraA family protein [Acidimicrobiia bacterium]